MRIRIFWILIIQIFISFKTYSHNSCNIFEYSNNRYNTGISANYFFAYYNSYAENFRESNQEIKRNYSPFAKVFHEPEETSIKAQKSEADYEFYSAMEFRFQYNLNDNWSISALLNYSEAEVYYERIFFIDISRPVSDTLIKLRGFGDPMIIVDRLLDLKTGSFTHQFRPGIGVKFPLGDTRKKSEYDALLLPGSGSWDILFRMNYQLIYRDAGLSILPNYRYNGVGANAYSKGNTLNLTIEPFYILRFTKDFALIPHVGVYYEYSRQDFQEEETIDLSGGKLAFLQAGLNLNYKQLTFINSFQNVIHQNLNGNQIQAGERINLGLLWNF